MTAETPVIETLRDRACELLVGEICWDLSPAPWPSSALVLARAVELLPTIDDGAILDLVEQLALAVVQGDEESEALRAVQSAALENLHRSCQENKRLRQRLAEARLAKQRTATGPNSLAAVPPFATLAARPWSQPAQGQAQAQHKRET